MSSFIEWPTIFGSTYFLPGIVIVVLLLTLLLLMSSRRRSKAERAHFAPEPVMAFGSMDMYADQPAPLPTAGASPVHAPEW